MRAPGQRTFQVLTALLIGVLFIRYDEWTVWFDGLSAVGAVLATLGAFGFYEEKK